MRGVFKLVTYWHDFYLENETIYEHGGSSSIDKKAPIFTLRMKLPYLVSLNTLGRTCSDICSVSWITNDKPSGAQEIRLSNSLHSSNRNMIWYVLYVLYYYTRVFIIHYIVEGNRKWVSVTLDRVIKMIWFSLNSKLLTFTGNLIDFSFKWDIFPTLLRWSNGLLWSLSETMRLIDSSL